MQREVNPYAPPASDSTGYLGTSQTGAYRIEGDLLIAAKGATLPPICVWSGEPAAGPGSPRQLVWAPMWVYVFAVSPLLFVIFYFIFRKKGTLDYSFGARALARRKNAIIIGVGGSVLAVAFFTIGLVAELPAIVPIATLTLLVSILVGSVRARLFTVARIDAEHIHLKLRPDALRAFAAAR
jgi:hypothetical protein